MECKRDYAKNITTYMLFAVFYILLNVGSGHPRCIMRIL